MINKSKLEAYLNEQDILKEERKMWYRLGFYIHSGPTEKDSYGRSSTVMVDVLCNRTLVSPNIASNLRRTMIEWWEAEKICPRTKELGKSTEVTPFDQLEVQREP